MFRALMLAVVLFFTALPGADASSWTPPVGAEIRELALSGDWERLEEGPLVFHYAEGDAGYARAMAEEGEHSLEMLRADLGTGLDQRIDVVLTRDEADFRELQGGHAPRWAAATAWSRQRLIFMRTDRALEETVQTFTHELSHVALREAIGDARVPRWFREGLAQRHAHQWGWERWQQLATAIVTGQLADFDELERRFRSPFGSQASLAYAQSAHFFTWLVKVYGPDIVPDLVREIAQGQSLEDGLLGLTGMRMYQLEHRWLASLRWTQGWIPALSGGGIGYALGAFLLFLGYLRRRRRFRRRLAEMAAAEARLDAVARHTAIGPLSARQGRPLDDGQFVYGWLIGGSVVSLPEPSDNDRETWLH